MNWYRCRAEIGDGGYVSYVGPSIGDALDSMANHVAAHTVVVEKMGYCGEWNSVVAGIWRTKKELTNGTLCEGNGVHADLAGTRDDLGVVHPQSDTRGR